MIARLSVLSLTALLLVGCPEIVVPMFGTTDVEAPDVALETGGDTAKPPQDVVADVGKACTDDSVCDDDNPCTQDKCSTAGTCAHFVDDNVCAIDSTCYPTGTVTSINLCKVCDPAKDAYGWSDVTCDDENSCTTNACDANQGCQYPADDDATCSDGLDCSADDHCAGGSCVGTCACTTDNDCTALVVSACERAACVSETCVGVSDDTKDGSSCDDGNACTDQDTCAGGSCEAGQAVVCDDTNTCTTDSCNALAGCQFVATGGTCDDGDPCTASDACLGGVCLGVSDTSACDDGDPCTDDACDASGGCSYTNNTAPCDDGNACTEGDACAGGACASGGFANCDDGSVCTTDNCYPNSGCAHTPADGSCDDGDECTDSDLCVDGACAGAGGLDCDDGDPCTTDGCTLAGGCSSVAYVGACDDGDECTQGETCATGTCAGGITLVCDDDNPCTDDSCDPGTGCKATNNTAACEDGDQCTTGDQCAGGACVGGDAADCDDGDGCTDDVCDPGAGCQYYDNAADCDDGDACTVGDACWNGGCVGGTAPDCDDDNSCTNDSCAAGSGCINSNNTATCDDGNGCTASDQCSGGSCQGSGGPNCDDGNPCTTDGCEPGAGCTNVNNTDACEDGDACTTGDACGGGSCKSGAALTCNDGNGCTDDACSPASGCVVTNNSTVCNDGNECTTGDKCSGGSCAGGVAPNCDDGEVCTTDSCSPVSGCVHTNNTIGCTDGDACTLNDVCAGGGCKSGSALSCNDNNGCTDDSCIPASGCVNSNNSNSCEDGSSCTTGDYCKSGSCLGGAAPDCDDQNTCTTDSCNDNSGCVNANNTLTCNDDSACTAGDVCSKGSCSGTAIVCNDNNGCTSDSCVPSTGCKYANNSNSCNDNNACTGGDVCSGGQCTGPTTVKCDDGNECTDDSCVASTGCKYANITGTCVDPTTGWVEACVAGVCTPDGGCFTGSTLVVTAQGERPIAEVEAGDMVLSTDQHSGVAALKAVGAVERKWARELTTLGFDGGSQLQATPNHYLFVIGTGWVMAGQVRPGDALRDDTGQAARVITVSTGAPATLVPVYNLAVEDTKTYHVGEAGVLAHTCDYTLNVADEALRARVMTDTPSASANTDKRLVVFSAQAGQLALVDSGTGAAKPLRCVPMGKWARRVGVKADHLVVLDAQRRALLTTPLQRLREVAQGSRECVATKELSSVTQLPGSEMPFDGLLAGDRVFVSYFGKSNRVEMYGWTATDGGPRLTHQRTWKLGAPGERLGLSGMAFDGETLFVAGAAFLCGGFGCDQRFAAPHLFAIDVDKAGAEVRDLAPANMNAVGVYRHPRGGAMFALLSGDHMDGYSSVQRIEKDGLGPEVGVGAGAGLGEKAFPVGPDHAVLLPLSGDHLFVLHVPSSAIVARWEFDGVAFTSIPKKRWGLDGRRQADFQDVIAHPGQPNRFTLVDSKSEQLVRVELTLDGAPAIKVLSRVLLANPAVGPATPAWAVWLD